MRRLALAATVVLLLASCGGDDDKKSSAASTSTSGGAATATSGTPTGSGAGSATTRSTATTRRGGTAAATTPPPPASAKLKPPAAGSYIYDNDGKGKFAGADQQIPSQSTLRIDAPTGGRQKSQRETKDGGNGTTTTLVLDYRDDGVYLVTLSTTTQQGTAFSTTQSFSPNPPPLFAPYPPVKGRAWSFDMTSEDGCETVHTDASWAAVGENVTIGGKPVSTARAAATVKLTATGKSGCTAINANQTTTQWVSAEHRLTVKEEQHINGTANGIPFSQDVTSTIRSVTPA